MTRSVSFGLIFAAIVVVALILGFCSNTKNSTDTAGSGQNTKSASTGASESATTSATPEPATAPSAESDVSLGASPDASAAVETGATGGEADEAATPAMSSNETTEAPAAASAATSTDSGATTDAATTAAPETAASTEVATSTADSATDGDQVSAATNAVVSNQTAGSADAAGDAASTAPTQAASDAEESGSSAAAKTAVEVAAGSGSQSPTDEAGTAQTPSITVLPSETQQAALPTDGSETDESAASALPVQEAIRPSFDVVRVDPDGNLVLAGRGAPGGEIAVTSNGQVVGTAKADDNGEWVIVPTAPLAPGNHQLALTQKQADGKAIEADKLVMVAVPEKGKDVAGAAATEDSGSLVVMVPGDDSGGAVVLQNPTEEPQEPVETATADSDGIASGALVLDAVDYDDEGDVTIGGRGTVDATIQVYLDNRLIGTSTVDAAGRWQVTPTSPVEPRLHTLRVDQIAPDGKVAARVESPFLRAERIDLPADQAFIVQPGNSLWRIARRTYGEGVRYTTIFQANREQIRDPDLIYPGQVFSIPQQAQTN